MRPCHGSNSDHYQVIDPNVLHCKREEALHIASSPRRSDGRDRQEHVLPTMHTRIARLPRIKAPGAQVHFARFARVPVLTACDPGIMPPVVVPSVVVDSDGAARARVRRADGPGCRAGGRARQLSAL
jgi:hypothetical protein